MRVRIQNTLVEPTLLVVADKLTAYLLESIHIGIEAKVFIKVNDWKTKILSIIVPRNRCAATPSEQAIEHFNAEPRVVEQSSVPIPNCVLVGHING